MQLEELLGGKIKILTAFSLVFVIGFASGFYYLDENRSSEVLTIKDCNSDCTALFKGSQESANNANQPENANRTAGDTVLSASSPMEASDSPEKAAKAFAGSKNSTLYHTRDCQYVKRIKTENLVWFNSVQEAAATGRQPHSCVGK